MTTGFDREQDELANGFTRFPEARAEAYRQAGYWQGKALDSILDEAAQRWPDKAAVVDASGTYSFAELDALADRIGAALAAQGILQGDRVLVQLPNSREFAVATFGLLRAGVVPVLCLPGHRSAELGHFAEVSGAVGLVIPDVIAGFDYRDLAAELVSEHPRLRHILVDGEPGNFQSWSTLKDFENPGPPDITVDTSGPAVLLVSGGTTGLPKLIPRTHDDYLYNATACAQACEMVHDDVYLAV